MGEENAGVEVAVGMQQLGKRTVACVFLKYGDYYIQRREIP